MWHRLGCPGRPAGRVALLAPPLLAIAVFVNALPNAFVFDDVHQVVANPWIRDFTHLREIFTTHVWAFAGRDSSYYRPLMHVTYAVVNATLGLTPWAFRALGVALHAMSTILVFLIAARLGRERAHGPAGVPAGAALVAALLFAVHPVHVEAVAWVSSLPDVACATLYLASLLAYLASATLPGRATGLHAAGAMAFLASALFKEPGVTLPGLVALWDAVRRPRAPTRSFWWTRYGGLALAAAIYLGLRLHAIPELAPPAPATRLGVMQTLDVAGMALWRYLGMLVWPFPLNVFRTLDDASGWPSWIPLLGLPLLIGVAWYRRQWSAAIGLGLLVVPLLPALYAPALLPGLDNPWAERYAYLPSAGFALLVASAGALSIRWWPATRWPLTVTFGLVVLVLGGATVARNRVWKDDLTLWTDAVRRSPHAGPARSYLGWALFSRGDVDRAIEEYRAAIALSPGLADAHHNLAVALAARGLHGAAVSAYAEAIRLKPMDARSQANLSLSLTRLGRYQEAHAVALRAVELDPRSARAHAVLGIALGEAGRLREAAAMFRRALELDPTDAETRQNLAMAERLLSSGQGSP